MKCATKIPAPCAWRMEGRRKIAVKAICSRKSLSNVTSEGRAWSEKLRQKRVDFGCSADRWELALVETLVGSTLTQGQRV